jgi:hypothetical protein
MSAHRITDCRIDCDWLNCGQSEFAGNLNTADMTAVNARMILKRRGWKVGLLGTDRTRRDYCPEHAANLVR